MGLVGCGDDDAMPELDAGTDAGAGSDAGTDSGPEIDVGTDSGRTADVCDELDLPRRDFVEGAGTAYGEIAGDFTVATTEGDWTLSEHWSGCESYVFINYTGTDYANQYWNSFADRLVTNSRPNVHYFFATYEEGRRAASRAEQIRQEIAMALDRSTPEEHDYWTPRMHFVETPLPDIEGPLGAFIRAQPFVQHTFAIDRGQRLDPGGSLSLIAGGGFTARLEMAAWFSPYYDYLDTVDRRAEDEEATVVPVLDEVDEAGAACTTDDDCGGELCRLGQCHDRMPRVYVREATLPSDLSGFDTLEFDVEIMCHLDPGGCSEWDRIAFIELCLDGEACTERRELVRWITPYSRPGRRRWIMDASPLLPLLGEGGTQHFRVVLGPEWEEPTPRDARVDLRLRTTGQPRARSAELAWTGGNFDGEYNAAKAPFVFTPPADASRVDVVTIVSGHGQTERDNCAEWCNHVHHFEVGGAMHVIDHEGQAGRSMGCAERAIEGVVPGQWGNWAPSRAAWCPGLPVDAVALDITSDLTLGAENTVTYRASFAGGEPRGGSMSLSTYVVVY